MHTANSVNAQDSEAGAQEVCSCTAWQTTAVQLKWLLRHKRYVRSGVKIIQCVHMFTNLHHEHYNHELPPLFSSEFWRIIATSFVSTYLTNSSGVLADMEWRRQIHLTTDYFLLINLPIFFRINWLIVHEVSVKPKSKTSFDRPINVSTN